MPKSWNILKHYAIQGKWLCSDESWQKWFKSNAASKSHLCIAQASSHLATQSVGFPMSLNSSPKDFMPRQCDSDVQWHILTHSDTQWHTVTHSDIQWHTVTHSDTTDAFLQQDSTILHFSDSASDQIAGISPQQNLLMLNLCALCYLHCSQREVLTCFAVLL